MVNTDPVSSAFCFLGWCSSSPFPSADLLLLTILCSSSSVLFQIERIVLEHQQSNSTGDFEEVFDAGPSKGLPELICLICLYLGIFDQRQAVNITFFSKCVTLWMCNLVIVQISNFKSFSLIFKQKCRKN